MNKLIYTIRGKQVMIDSDIAMLYKNKTENINKAMKENLERFPEDFCFQLTKEELKSIKLHLKSTTEKENLPYVYTEEGIAMLMVLLKEEMAVNISINIMRAFIERRKFILIKDKDIHQSKKVKK